LFITVTASSLARLDSAGEPFPLRQRNGLINVESEHEIGTAVSLFFPVLWNSKVAPVHSTNFTIKNTQRRRFMTQNVTQRLITSHLVSGQMKQGEEIALKIDQTLTQDATGTLALRRIRALVRLA
jgi:hypothetical protein